MLSASGPGGVVWAIAGMAMLAVLIVVFVRQLRRTSEGPGTLVAAAVVSALVVVGIVVLLLTGAH